MPSLLDPTLLRGQQPGDDPTGIQTLLGSIGSALSGGVAAPNDPNTTMASILAAGNALANAGAPTLGPPPTTAQAILGALSNARGAAVQTGILPYLQERAQQQLESQNLDYQTKLFDFNRRVNAANLLRGGVSADPAAGTPVVPGVPVASPAVSPPIIQRDPSVPVAGDQANNPGNLMYAFQPGATGRLPLSGDRTLAVFPDMPTGIAANANQLITNQDQYGLNTVRGQVTRWVSDPKANLTGTDAKGVAIPNVAGTPAASGSYIGDVAKALGVDPDAPLDFHDAGVLSKYILAMRPHESGPAALDPHDVTAGVQLALNPAKRVQVADASGRTGGGGGPPAPPGGSSGGPGDPMVNVAGMPGLQVPRSVELAARSVAVSAADPYAAYSAAIKDYVEKKATMPTFRPGGASGTQVSSQGEVSAATPGTPTLRAATPDERKTMFPNVPAWQDILLKVDPAGNIVDHVLPSMGPEREIPISDEDAKKPPEQGGVGNAYQPGAIYVRGERTGLPKPMQMERQAAPPQGADATGFLPLTPQVVANQNDLAGRANRDPRISNFTQQLTSLGRINNLAYDPTRTATDDLAALQTFFNFMSPGYVVRQEGPDAIVESGGPEQRVQSVIAHLAGGRFLTPDTLQNVVNTLNTEAEGARVGYTVASNTYRDQARRQGINPDNVTPDPDLLIQQYQAAGAASRARLAAGKGVGAQTVVPGAAPTERSGNLPVVPVPPPAQLDGMNAQGLTALVTDIKNNPARYGNAEQQQAHLNAVQAAINRKKAAMPPPAGGGG